MEHSWRQASIASLELQCRETMEIRTKHLGAGFEAGLEAGLKGPQGYGNLIRNNMTKKGPVFPPQNVRKSRRAKMGPSQFKIPAAAVAGQTSFNLDIKRFQQIFTHTMKVPKKLDPPGVTTFDFKGVPTF